MLAAERLREVLHYNPSTGAFTRLVTRGNRKAGSVAGTARPDGYVEMMVDGRLYLAHRLAWFWVKGCWPDGEIDHENLCRADNVFDNLRPATKSQNGANRRAYRSGLSGIKGVSRRSGNKEKPYVAHIRVNGRRIHLGCHVSAEQASAAYVAAAATHFGKFARAS